MGPWPGLCVIWKVLVDCRMLFHDDSGFAFWGTCPQINDGAFLSPGRRHISEAKHPTLQTLREQAGGPRLDWCVDWLISLFKGSALSTV